MNRTLAIKGHAKKGKKVIEILEILGGRNTYNYRGTVRKCFYFVNNFGEIDLFNEATTESEFIPFTLEEFLGKFPYKVGDKVNVSSYKNIRIDNMKWSGTEMLYEVFINETEWYSAAELNIFNEHSREENVEDKRTLVEIDLTKELKKSNEIEVILGDYEFVLKNGKTYFVKKKTQYPKTYKECCKILNYIPNSYDADEMLVYGYMCDELRILQKLLVCRNAYWKIAGEKMELGKPYEPNWSIEGEIKYVIEVYRNTVRKNSQGYSNTTLVFPTKEMRDAFYDNFKKLIEKCKNLL